jgi:hypothetical protein
MPKEIIVYGREQSPLSGFVFGRSLVPVSTQALSLPITADILFPLFSPVLRYNAGLVLLDLQ